MTYKLVLFDLDGTLSDSYPWFLRIIGGVADRHGFRRIEESEIETLRGKSSREIVAHLRVPAWRLPFIARDMRRMKTAALGEIPLFPGTGAMLRALSERGIVTAMVSSDNEANVRTALGPDNAALISHFACGASLFGKARNFRRVLKAAGIAPHEAIAIGDEVRDLEAARAAGIAFGAVSWGYATPQALRERGADHVFASMEEMAARLAALHAREEGLI